MILEPIVKEPTEVEVLEKQVETLEAEKVQIILELKQVKIKIRKRPSIGYFRTRFKGG